MALNRLLHEALQLQILTLKHTNNSKSETSRYVCSLETTGSKCYKEADTPFPRDWVVDVDLTVKLGTIGGNSNVNGSEVINEKGHRPLLSSRDKRQYLLTLQVIRYCLLGLQSSMMLPHFTPRSTTRALSLIQRYYFPRGDHLLFQVLLASLNSYSRQNELC